jgi:hypothetical protein
VRANVTAKPIAHARQRFGFPGRFRFRFREGGLTCKRYFAPTLRPYLGHPRGNEIFGIYGAPIRLSPQASVMASRTIEAIHDVEFSPPADPSVSTVNVAFHQLAVAFGGAPAAETDATADSDSDASSPLTAASARDEEIMAAAQRMDFLQLTYALQDLSADAAGTGPVPAAASPASLEAAPATVMANAVTTAPSSAAS